MLMFKLKQLLLYWPGKPGVANLSWSQLSHLTVNFSEVSISIHHVTELYIIIDSHF